MINLRDTFLITKDDELDLPLIKDFIITKDIIDIIKFKIKRRNFSFDFGLFCKGIVNEDESLILLSLS